MSCHGGLGRASVVPLLVAPPLSSHPPPGPTGSVAEDFAEWAGGAELLAGLNPEAAEGRDDYKTRS